MSVESGFAGEPIDANNLVYLRNRYYNPALGVFPSLDPYEGDVNNPMSLNRYAYVQGNPVNLVDPSGMTHERPSQFAGCASSDNQYNTLSECLLACIDTRENYRVRPPCFSEIEQPDCAHWNRRLLDEVCPHCAGLPADIPLWQSTSNFRLPMDDARLTAYGCNWVVSGGVQQGLRSRDVNPPGPPTFSPVYAPVPEAEVWLVDDLGNNSGLGNFVVLRVNTQYLPPEVQANLPGTGYLYIGYAHLSVINVSEGQRVPSDMHIGRSGQTGTDNVHLDLTVLFNTRSRESTEFRATLNDDSHQRFYTFGWETMALRK